MAVPTIRRTQAHPFNDCPEVYVSKCERESHAKSKRPKEKLNMKILQKGTECNIFFERKGTC
jgi:hypothetical protein